MKIKNTAFLAACLWVLSLSLFAQQQVIENPVWSRIYTQKDAKSPVISNYRYVPERQTPQYFNKNGVEAIISPNFRLMPTTTSTQSEMSIDMHPNNPEIIFGSANATNSPVTTIYGTGVYYTTNGGTNWLGNDNPPFGSNSGDPAACIGPEGNMYVGFIDGGSNLYGQGIGISTNNGTTWTRAVVSPKPASSADMLDKNHMYVDKKENSPYKGRLYAAWTDFISSSTNNYKLGFRYSTDKGVTWSAQKNISAGLTPSYLAQGVNINTGANGEVYAVWAVYEDNSVSTGEDAIGFNMSTDGGETWGTPKKIYTKTNFGIRGTLSSKAGIRVSSFPSMTVNRNTGEIYVTFPQEGGIAPCGNSIDICLIKSTDGGATFSAPVRVNNDDLNNSKDQYYPWATIDQSTGSLYIVFYDSREVRNDSAQVYVAASINGGVTFENVRVSDANFKPKTISGLASGYQGDYIGIAAVSNTVYPYWADDRTGLYQGWSAKVVFAQYPLNPFNLTAPAANTSISSFPNSAVQHNFTWDTSASTASYKWIFGTAAEPRKIVLSAGTNKVILSAGQLDDLLAGIGVAQGDSLVGQWNVWAYRNNAPLNDSLVSANGPRALTLKRGIPQLLPFTLSEPGDNSRLVTSANNSSQIQIKWTRSGEGIKYRWQFKTPDFNGQTQFNVPANSNGYDTALTISNAFLDGMLSGLGLNTGDSLVGQWRIYAYRNPSDSLASQATFNLTLKRQDLGEYLVVFDSSSSNCRISRDSVLSALNSMGKTYDLINRGSTSSGKVFSIRSYKNVIWLGEGTSTMSAAQKDSVKAFLSVGGTTVAAKSKLIILSEDIGYNFDRTGATLIDTTFTRNWLGIQYAMDRPYSGGAQGVINLTTNETDSISGSGWPDVLRKSASNPTGRSLYRFRGMNSTDSVNAVGKISMNYNVAVYGMDVEALRRASDSPGGSTILRVLTNAVQYVNEMLAPPSPMVTVNAPNGGENWTSGTQKNITWSSINVQNVKLAYTTNNGADWLAISASVPSTGTYAWTVPATPSTQCKVKVTSVLADSISDVSNAVFTISNPLPTITWEVPVTFKETGAGQQIINFGMAPT
ncbi:MAG: exo-alpha-sialidase, partial [Ignavibacteriales bacterium]|nr:exo-alpha-sialidase [Ignavibacteriales bacterium]